MPLLLDRSHAMAPCRTRVTWQVLSRVMSIIWKQFVLWGHIGQERFQ